jgi:tRNA pseudouridine55 synthase
LLDDCQEYKGQTITFPVRIACSKGTYIRTLAVQIGELLGYPAHMASLVRIQSGTFTKEDCVTLEQMKEKVESGTVNECIKPLEYALMNFPHIELTEENFTKIINGQMLPIHPLLEEHDKIVFIEKSKAVAVYVKHPEKKGLMKPEKMFPKVD